MPATPDIALVSLGTTPGLRRADDAFASMVREAGASCALVRVPIGHAGRLRRHPAVTDLVEALASRRAAASVSAGAVVYSTVTAALLQPARAPYAVRFDSPAALNRPGPGGAWQRWRERSVLERARLLLPWGAAAGGAAGSGAESVVVPVPVEELQGAAERDIDAIAYAGYPRKRGLDVLCRAWERAAPARTRLAIGGVEREAGLAWLDRCGVPEPAGIDWLGPLPRERWLAAVGRARLFVNASRREDHGLAQLEALAAGAALVTVPSPGPYEALPLARRLDPALVAREVSTPALAEAISAGLGMTPAERSDYARRASGMLAPYRHEAILATVRERVLPALLGEGA